MTQAKHQSPSRLRYNAAHRTLGVHVGVADYDRLLAMREASGLSFGQLFLATLGEVELKVNAARQAGYQEGYTAGSKAGHETGGVEGYEEAMKEWQLSFPCFVCGHNVVVNAGSPQAEAAIAAVMEQGWGHRKCADA